MNRHQKKVLSLAAAIGNLALSVSVAGVATYAWFASNREVSGSELKIACSVPEVSLSWEILHYDDDIKAGKSYDDSGEFYLQDYDVYLTQKNKYANCILVATLDFGVSFTKDTHLAIDISCVDGHAPVYGSECPAYTSNVCQFKTSAYSYTTTGNPVILNDAIDATSAATRYSSASTWFGNYPSQFEKFVSVVSNTPYKRSNQITVVPDLSGLSSLSAETEIKQVVLYIECSYNAQLVDYYINTYNQFSGEYFALEADLENIEIRVSKQYTGAYVRVDSGTLTDGEYLIVNEANKIALDGSLSTYSDKNYADVHPIKNRIRKTEVTEALQFTYDASAKTFTNEAGSQIGFDGSNITTGSYAHTSASATGGNANILFSGSNYLRFNNTANVTKFNYASNSSYQNVAVYKYDSSADYNVYVTGIAITTATTDLEFNRYDLFKHDGLVVTATFNNDDTADVTNNCIYTIAGTIHTETSPVAVSGEQIVKVDYIDPDNGHYFASVTYIITIHDQVVTLSDTTLMGTGGLTGTLTASTQYFTGTPSFTWSTSNSSAVVVNGNGATATLVYIAGGSATITCRATLGSQTAFATCSVTVRDGIPVTSVTVAPTSFTIRGVGNTTTLAATILPTNATNQDISWYSEDTEVATVNSNGVVTGVATGNTYIYAYSDTNRNGSWDQGEPRGGCRLTVSRY